MTEHHGWRVFSLREDGRLRPPFVERYLPDQYDPARDDWRPGVNEARCVFGEHEPDGAA